MQDTNYYIKLPEDKKLKDKINKPMTIALLADFHNRPYEKIIGSLKRRKPDIIAIFGDIVHGGAPANGQSKISSSEYVLPFLRSCSELAPSYFSMGNHEWMLTDEDKQLIENTGVTFLDDNWVEKNGIQIGGLTSGRVTAFRNKENMNPLLRQISRIQERMTNVWDDQVAPDYDWLSDFSNQPGFKILLCHHPDYWEKYLQDYKIDLVLSGHAHGGQFRYFSKGKWHGFIATGQGFFPKYTEGVFEGKNGDLVVSRGLSNTGSPFIPRVNNPTEVVYVELS